MTHPELQAVCDDLCASYLAQHTIDLTDMPSPAATTVDVPAMSGATER